MFRENSGYEGATHYIGDKYQVKKLHLFARCPISATSIAEADATLPKDDNQEEEKVKKADAKRE